MLINTYLDTEDFVHLYYPEDEPAPATPQGCGAGARMASKYPPRPPSPDYTELVPVPSTSDMTERERYRAPPPPDPPPPPHRVRASDLYPRLRTHYDEPGLDIAFTPICGEFVKWVGRLADGGTIAMSNYRIHVQPKRRGGAGTSVPLHLIDSTDNTDATRVVINCKHGRQLVCLFSTTEKGSAWNQRITGFMSSTKSLQTVFATAYAAWAKELPPASVHRALLRASHSQQRHWFGVEVERMGFTTKGAWRITAANVDYKLCSSYPPMLVVPATIGDEDLDSVARFRALRRIPTVVWRHQGNGAVIARSSQPEVGWFGWRSSEDERLLAAFVSACNADRGTLPPAPPNKNLKLLIVDARSYASAVTNRARGGGCECQQYYPAADIQFMSLPNIHHVRKSFQTLRSLIHDSLDQASFHTQLERSLWLHYVAGVVRAAGGAARAVAAGRPVLVHCSDGWDRTPQIVATAQLMLDPHYRTLDGFRILVEREWLDFGHKFADRCGHQFAPEDVNERSPIFLQWLDVVHQMMIQFPCSFEFNEAYLVKLATHVHSCMFGTFLCNTSRERAELRVPETTAQVWHLLRAPAYRNHLYSPHHQEQELWPQCSVGYMRLWWALFGGAAPALDERDEPPPAPPAAYLPPLPPLPQADSKGLMTKTRSCENLASEVEKRSTQRRCSDPSLAPDVMKLSVVVNGSGECRSALTDSCVDELPALPAADHADGDADGDLCQDQVDGLHPNHFENGSCLPRDLASDSSSLERELAGVGDTSKPDQDPDDKVKVEENDSAITEAITAEAMAESVIQTVVSPDDTPEEPPVFVCDTYSDVIGMAEAARESARTRNISITWRSISESSNQSSAFDIAEAPQNRSEPAIASHESSPIDVNNHNSTEGDVVNHNVVSELTNHNRESSVTNGVNGIESNLEVVAAKFLEVDINGGATSSSISSESDGEAQTHPRRAHARTRVASQLTLCPASPRKFACCHCSRRASTTSGIETSGESGASSEACWCGVCGGAVGAGAGGAGGARVRCVCGAWAAPPHYAPPAPDPLDGLPPAPDRLQARLHQIILYQKKVVEELKGQLREAHEALKRAGPPSLALPAPSPTAPDAAQMAGSASGSSPQAGEARSGSAGSGSGSAGSGSGSAGSGSGSGSGSASEVEVGEEARGVVWVPDSAAPRCQYCRNNFWLARRRHHCRYDTETDTATGTAVDALAVRRDILRVVLGDELVGRVRLRAHVSALPRAAVTRARPRVRLRPPAPRLPRHPAHAHRRLTARR